MKNLVTGIFIGALLGGVVGTVASDEIYDISRKIVKNGKKMIKKYNWI